MSSAFVIARPFTTTLRAGSNKNGERGNGTLSGTLPAPQMCQYANPTGPGRDGNPFPNRPRRAAGPGWLPRTNGRDHPRTQGSVRKGLCRYPDAPGTRRRPHRPGRSAKAMQVEVTPGSEDAQGGRTPPQGQRVATGDRCRQGEKSSRDRPAGGDHPSPGNPGHGSPPSCSGNAERYSGYAGDNLPIGDQRKGVAVCCPTG